MFKVKRDKYKDKTQTVYAVRVEDEETYFLLFDDFRGGWSWVLADFYVPAES